MNKLKSGNLIYNYNFNKLKKDVKQKNKEFNDSIVTNLNTNKKLSYNKLKSNSMYDIFLYKIFKKFIIKGNKNRIIKYFINWLSILQFKIISKSIIKNKQVSSKKKFKADNNFVLKKKLFIIQILNKIVPKLYYKNKSVAGKTKIIPVFHLDKFKRTQRLSTIVSIWFKKSLSYRKEKTLFLKLYSELNDMRLNKSNVLKLKNEYYKNFLLNIRFYKSKKKRL